MTALGMNATLERVNRDHFTIVMFASVIEIDAYQLITIYGSNVKCGAIIDIMPRDAATYRIINGCL